MSDWTLSEAVAIRDAMLSDAFVSGLKKFCEGHAGYENQRCAQLMRQVPADKDRAANAAAQAQVYENFVAELAAHIDKFQPGPTGA